MVKLESTIKRSVSVLNLRNSNGTVSGETIQAQSARRDGAPTLPQLVLRYAAEADRLSGVLT